MDMVISKGQTQVVSIIIVVVVALAAVASVVPWANNMIQKRKDAKTADDTFNFFQKLDKTIRGIAENGGEETLELETDGILTIYPASINSEFNNSIAFLFESRVSNVAEGTWIPLNTPNTNGTASLGIDPPSVIFGRSTRINERLNTEYRLWYRNLTDSGTGKIFRIDLKTADGAMKEVETGAMRIQRVGSSQVQNLTITEINIIV